MITETDLLLSFYKNESKYEYRDQFDPNERTSQKLELRLISEYTKKCYGCDVKLHYTRSVEELCNVLRNCFALEADIFKLWIRDHASKSIVCTNSYDRFTWFDYDVAVKCFIANVVEKLRLGKLKMSITPKLILSFCRLAFQRAVFPTRIYNVKQRTSRLFDHREYVNDGYMFYAVRGFDVLLRILEEESPEHYFPLRFFMAEFPRFPLYSMAKDYYDVKFSAFTSFQLMFRYRPGSGIYYELEKEFEEKKDA